MSNIINSERNLANDTNFSADELLNIPIDLQGLQDNDILQYDINTNSFNAESPTTAGLVANAQNIGGFSESFKSKVGTDLIFRTIQSSDNSVVIQQNINDLDFSVNSTSLTIGDGVNQNQTLFQYDTGISPYNYELRYHKDLYTVANNNAIYLSMDAPIGNPSPLPISNFLVNSESNAFIDINNNDPANGLAILRLGNSSISSATGNKMFMYRSEATNSSGIGFTRDNLLTGLSGNEILNFTHPVSGGGAIDASFTLSGNIDVGNSKITSLADGVNPLDAVNKGQLDAILTNNIVYTGSTSVTAEPNKYYVMIFGGTLTINQAAFDVGDRLQISAISNIVTVNLTGTCFYANMYTAGGTVNPQLQLRNCTVSMTCVFDGGQTYFYITNIEQQYIGASTSLCTLNGEKISSTDILNNLRDINITSPANGEILTYSSGTSTWINSPQPAASTPIYGNIYYASSTVPLTPAMTVNVWTVASITGSLTNNLQGCTAVTGGGEVGLSVPIGFYMINYALSCTEPGGTNKTIQLSTRLNGVDLSTNVYGGKEHEDKLTSISYSHVLNVTVAGTIYPICRNISDSDDIDIDYISYSIFRISP